MRARWLKPEFFKDRKIGALGPIPALVYQALWCLADDGGMAHCDPEVIKGEMFVHWSSVGLPEISEALRQLYTAQRIHFFQGSDELFAEIVNFPKHQKVHNPSKHRNVLLYNDFHAVLPQWCGSPASVLPPSSPPRHLDSYTPRHLDSKTPTAVSNETGSQDTSVLEFPKKPAKRTKHEYSPEFEATYLIYPKPAGDSKADAAKAFEARRKDGCLPTDIHDGVVRYAAYIEARGGDRTYAKHAATFFGPGLHFQNEWTLPTLSHSTKSYNQMSPAEKAVQMKEQMDLAVVQMAQRAAEIEKHRQAL